MNKFQSDGFHKLQIVLLCIIFFGVGYVVANFNTLKERFCATKETILDTSAKFNPINTLSGDYDEPLSQTIHLIKSGDTLDSIAKLYGVTKEALMKENNLKTEKISTEEILLIPTTSN